MYLMCYLLKYVFAFAFMYVYVNICVKRNISLPPYTMYVCSLLM